MARNIFRNLRTSSLLPFGRNAREVMINNPDYGLSNSQLTALNVANNLLEAKILEAETARQNYHSKTEELKMARAGLVDNLSAITKIIYARTQVTDAMLIAAGFEPRDTHRTSVTPVRPQDLMAKPQANGDVTLTWKRAGNPYGVAFVIESKPEVGEWKPIHTTTRTRVTLRNFAPGQGRWFRVLAVKNEQVSPPSDEAPIYHADEDTQIHIAA